MYVGQSTDPAARYRCHVSACASKRVKSWIDGLSSPPTLRIEKIVDTREAAFRVERELMIKLKTPLNRIKNRRSFLVHCRFGEYIPLDECSIKR